MKIGMVVELGMVIAAVGFGIYAVRHSRSRGVPLLDALGLRWDRLAAIDLLAGIAIAASAMLGIFFAELALDAIALSPEPKLGAAPLLLSALGKLAATFKEEFIMRALLLSGLLLALRGRAAWAVGLSALAFGLIHLSNPGASPLSVLGNGLGGVIYGMAFVLSGKLWLPIGLHFAWNFTQGPLLGFPVSGMDAGGLQTLHDLGPAWLTGAAYGPEAGVVGIAFRFVIIALALLWIKSALRLRFQARSGLLPGGPAKTGETGVRVHSPT